MKQISLKSLPFFASILLITSCALKEGEIKVNTETTSEGLAIKATLELPQDATRTSLTSEGKVLWSNGDAFSLLSAKSNDRFELVEGDGQANASFWGTVTGDAPYYALYPYSESTYIEDGSVKFSLPQEQEYVNGTFASGASPAIASLPTVSDAASFRNLCGVLELNLIGVSSIKVKSIDIINLDGKPLWGDCTVALDGKQGTDEQTMTVTGGSNVLKINFDKEELMKPATPKTIEVVVPAGSFAKGFTIKIKDANGEVQSFLTCQSEKVKIARSFIFPMDKYKVPKNGEPLEVGRRGYYKDVFMDGGVKLTSRTTLPVCPYLGWSLDFLATSDSLLQASVIVKSAKDENGALLYPDTEPRYRMIYVNGGKAASHGKSLGTTGRNRIQTFVNKGGCYVGSCAGAFIAHESSSYLSIIPASMTNSGLNDSYTGMAIPKDSPLLNYGYDFGGDLYVDRVYHNGGGYMKASNLPGKGEILATYVKSGWKMNGNGSIWAYKANDVKGRVVVTGSHPEGVSSGEQRDLMAAMVRYATDGAGVPKSKTELQNGVERNQNKKTGINAGVGDKQYHHYTVNIPEGAKNIKVSIVSDSDLDLHLAMRKGDFAWRTDSDILLAQAGSTKTLTYDTLEAGLWYISVYSPAEVHTTCASDKFTQAGGDVKALNGVPYAITVSWE